MRPPVILVVLGLLLAFIAWQARTGIFRRADPGEPANKYVREMQETRNLNADEAALIADRLPGATVTPSGLRFIVRTPGEGSPPPVGARVTTHYHGTLLTGQKFDSSYDRGEPFSFRVGTGAVIRGWDEAFATMKRGERRTLIVPWWLAYGEEGRPPRIPPRATLVFDVELIDFR
jgi:FKBP-type peptidyl-prolyl cis-trans isomerase